MMRFEFATASRIIFGGGTVQEVTPMASRIGSCALVVVGRSMERAVPLLEALSQAGLQAVTFNIPFEPTINLTMEGVLLARQNSCDVVIGMGGGNYKIKNGGKDGTFIFRFGAGAEWLFMDSLGAYMDLSLDATPGLKRFGDGGATGVIQFGLTGHL